VGKKVFYVGFVFFFSNLIFILSVLSFLGTGGYLTQALADVIRRLWSDQSIQPTRAIKPRPFKRALGQFRSEFQGYDQQDAHEFLLAVLSAVHEDTNRCDPTDKKNNSSGEKVRKTKITDKKIDENGHGSDGGGSGGGSSSGDDDIRAIVDETSEGEKKGEEKNDETNETKEDQNTTTTATTTAAATAAATATDKTTSVEEWKKRINIEANKAWKKHKEQSHSIVVDLFHGQLCRSNICDHCKHRIDRFEPFPCLSVNLRVQFAHKIIVIRLPKSTTTSSSTAADHRHIVQYGVLTPQVGLVGDLKMSLSDKCGIKSNRLCIAVLSNAKKKNIQIYSDSNPLRTVSLS
jgi:hypothetical protein